MSYQKFGISPQLVERVKFKAKNPATKERLRKLLGDATKYDLQDRLKVRKLTKSAATILQEKLTETQEEQIVTFVLAQKIDPNNTLHLLKLWSMFR
ncbi:stage VI sporulation protein F [Paenibacillus endoradicis]|uniref:stage VI sporulation protein F n=1 Tax=Paenibacillus endoradicis TaxID=2972487 RepID=UPI002158E5CA|nr:stage VI sporulation protein F [Paenibacillus endoradicis]MCR8656130.1 stage VI sporulation protein F [Paenibacillus endoradicis]MCR8658456.1 stage VI sporulation protein F [Paenibacillus endoradicis]